MTARPGTNALSRIGWWLALLAPWLLFWAAGFPLPNWDDLFFVGGAIELTRSGELANPLLRFWNPVAAERYFFQTPLYPYALAGWIETFGLGARSLLAFQAAAGAVFSVAAALLFRRQGFSGGLVLPVVLAFALAPQGLRHDALGLALLALGLWLSSFAKTAWSFLGAVVLALAVATWPVLLAYAAPFGLAVALGNGRSPGTPFQRHAVRRLAVCAAGAGMAFLLFLTLLRFRLTEFLTDFAWHAGLRRPALGNLLPELRHHLTNGWAEVMYPPLYLLLLLLAAVTVLRRDRVRPEAKVFLAALGAGSLATLFLYASMLHLVVDLFCWIGLVVLLGEIPMAAVHRRTAAAATAAAFLLAHSHLLLTLAGRMEVPAARYAEIREVLRDQQPTLLGVDEVAARFVFDYRLPADAFFWNYSVPPQKTWPASTAEKPPDVTWVVSPAKSRETQGVPPSEGARIFGRELGSIPARYYDVVVIGRTTEERAGTAATAPRAVHFAP